MSVAANLTSKLPGRPLGFSQSSCIDAEHHDGGGGGRDGGSGGNGRCSSIEESEKDKEGGY